MPCMNGLCAVIWYFTGTAFNSYIMLYCIARSRSPHNVLHSPSYKLMYFHSVCVYIRSAMNTSNSQWISQNCQWLFYHMTSRKPTSVPNRPGYIRTAAVEFTVVDWLAYRIVPIFGGLGLSRSTLVPPNTVCCLETAELGYDVLSIFICKNFWNKNFCFQKSQCMCTECHTHTHTHTHTCGLQKLLLDSKPCCFLHHAEDMCSVIWLELSILSYVTPSPCEGTSKRYGWGLRMGADGL